MHLDRYDQMRRRMENLEIFANVTNESIDDLESSLKVFQWHVKHNGSGHESRGHVKARLIKEGEYEKEMLDIKKELRKDYEHEIKKLKKSVAELEKKLLIDHHKYHVSAKHDSIHLRSDANSSTTERNSGKNSTEVDILTDVVRELKKTHGNTIDSLTRKVILTVGVERWSEAMEKSLVKIIV